MNILKELNDAAKAFGKVKPTTEIENAVKALLEFGQSKPGNNSTKSQK